MFRRILGKVVSSKTSFNASTIEKSPTVVLFAAGTRRHPVDEYRTHSVETSKSKEQETVQ